MPPRSAPSQLSLSRGAPGDGSPEPPRCCSADSPPGALLNHLSQILVSTPGKTQHVIANVVTRVLEPPRNRMRGLQRRDDPLEPRQLGEGRERLRVGHREV